jgi:CBS domain-containing protein
MTLRAITLLPEPVCVDPDTPLRNALQMMLEMRVNHLPVCERGGWIGLVDINDILGELLPVSARGEYALRDLRFVGDGVPLLAARLGDLAGTPVRAVELRDLPTLDDDTPLLEAALLLHRHGKPLPVLTGGGQLRGMLSRRTLIAHLIQLTGA